VKLPDHLWTPRNLSPVAIFAGVATSATLEVAAPQGQHWGLAGPLVTVAIYLLKAAVDLNRNWNALRQIQSRLARIERKLAIRDDDTPPLVED
jgi:hypothetical protein